MTTFIGHPRHEGLVRISGTITNYRVSRESASFVFTKGDQNRLGAVAVAASLAGLGAQAISAASNATAMEEEADHVHFDIDGVSVSGWLWHSPFKDGDRVDVAAEACNGHYECFGVSRPSDRTIALYPHCTRSRQPHIRNAIKWWIYASLIFEALLSGLASTIDSMTLEEFWSRSINAGAGWVLAGIHAFIAVAIWSMAQKWMPFTELAEKIFTALALPDAAKIDLVKSSRRQAKATDTLEFGSMYFRYELSHTR